MFRGYRNLKSSSDEEPISKDQKIEIEKCKKDSIYFINNYIYNGYIIDNKETILNKIILKEFQEDYIKHVLSEKKVLSIWGRQSGNTTIHLAYYLWKILFVSESSVGIINLNRSCSIDDMNIILNFLQRIPMWMQLPCERVSNKSIRFRNENKIFILNEDVRGLTLPSDIVVFNSSYMNNLNENVKELISHPDINLAMTSTGLGIPGNNLLEFWKKYDWKKLKYGYKRYIKNPDKFRIKMVNLLGAENFKAEYMIEAEDNFSTIITDTSIYS